MTYRARIFEALLRVSNRLKDRQWARISSSFPTAPARQDGGARPEQRISNIYKMYRVSRDHADTAIDPSQQVVFYDAGLGTDIGATAFTAPVRFVQKILGSVAGDGIKRNIADCYEFIVNHYEDSDRIFLFGFSRGAYTVRSLANLLMLCGVPHQNARWSGDLAAGPRFSRILVTGTCLITTYMQKS